MGDRLRLPPSAHAREISKVCSYRSPWQKLYDLRLTNLSSRHFLTGVIEWRFRNQLQRVDQWFTKNQRLFRCAAHHVPNDYQAYIHKLVQKYWHLVDVDNSRSLIFDEYKYTIAGFAAVDAGLIIKVIEN